MYSPKPLRVLDPDEATQLDLLHRAHGQERIDDLTEAMLRKLDETAAREGVVLPSRLAELRAGLPPVGWECLGVGRGEGAK